MGVAELFAAAVDRLLESDALRNVEVVAKTARRQGASTELRIMIDRPGGIDIEVCEILARGINAALQDNPELYTLEVESAGLERPLVRPADYERFAGRNVCIKTHKLWEGAKTHRGTLTGLRDGQVVLEVENGPLLIPYAGIKQAHLEFDIRAALRRSEAAAPKTSPRGKKRENQEL